MLGKKTPIDICIYLEDMYMYIFGGVRQYREKDKYIHRVCYNEVQCFV